MFKKNVDLQNVQLVTNALEHLTNEFEILENGEVFGGNTQWDTLREFVNNDDNYAPYKNKSKTNLSES